MLKIQVVSFILCLMGAFKGILQWKYLCKIKIKKLSAGTYHKMLCGASLAPRLERPVWINEGRSSEVCRPLFWQAFL